MKKLPVIKFNIGFTLIELLVVISIIGVLLGLSVFSLQSARASSRDAKRKADLELIRSGIEIYKADCNKYPVSLSAGDPANVLAVNGTQLVGNGTSSPSCLVTNIYISQLPTDPTSPVRKYLYWSDGVTYEMCTALEQVSGAGVTCGGLNTCGTATCNYKVTNP